MSDGFFMLIATWAGRTVSFADVVEVFVEGHVAGDELHDDL